MFKICGRRFQRATEQDEHLTHSYEWSGSFKRETISEESTACFVLFAPKPHWNVSYNGLSPLKDATLSSICIGWEPMTKRGIRAHAHRSKQRLPTSFCFAYSACTSNNFLSDVSIYLIVIQKRHISGCFWRGDEGWRWDGSDNGNRDNQGEKDGW